MREERDRETTHSPHYIQNRVGWVMLKREKEKGKQEGRRRKRVKKS